MNYLAVDTSNKNLTVIIKKDGREYRYEDAECGVNHSIELMPCIEKLAKDADFDFNSADFIACVVGAGSFTGIRIGIATVKAMCFALNKPCLSVTSFDTLAYNKDGKVLALIDAKHNGFYACAYQDKKVVMPPEYISRERVEELIKEYTPVAFAPIDRLPVQVVSVASGLVLAIEKNLDKVTSDLESLTPLYVRKSQAEEGR